MVSIIACTYRNYMKDNIFDNYARQEWKHKELIIILNNNLMNIAEWEEKAKDYENVFIYQVPEEKTLGECLNFGIEKSNYDTIAKFDDDDYYSPFYLTEQMEAIEATGAKLIGKSVSFVYFKSKQLLTLYKMRFGSENNTVKSYLKGGTLVFKKELYPEIKFPARKQGSDTGFVVECNRKNVKIHSTSRYNYVYIRRSKFSHTYKISNKKLFRRCTVVARTSDYKNLITRKIK